MAIKQVTLNEAAKAIKVHPRTVLRAISKDKNPYWTSSYDPILSVSVIAKGFNTNQNCITDALSGRDQLITTNQAAKAYGLTPRGFRYLGLAPDIRNGSVVRYRQSRIASGAIARSLI